MYKKKINADRLRKDLPTLIAACIILPVILLTVKAEGSGNWYLYAVLACGAAICLLIHGRGQDSEKQENETGESGKEKSGNRGNEIRKSGKPGRILEILWTVLTLLGSPAAAFLLLQNYTLDPFGEKGVYTAMLFVNFLFAYLFYFLLTGLLGSVRRGYLLGDAVFALVGIANYFVVQFRGSPIVPWDLLSLRTAASVAGGYTYELGWRFAWTSIGFLFLLALTWRSERLIKMPLLLRGALAALSFAGILLAGTKLQQKDVKDWLGMDQTLFTPNVRYRNNGFIAAFAGNLYLIRVEKPEGYSTGKVEQIRDELAAEQTTAVAAFDVTKAPNIIVIMDEAFSDLAVLGEFGVDTEYLPNFTRLQKEYAGGYLMTSVKGGNTANTEYEFLSGDTMAFLPAGSVVYQQFIHGEVPSIPAQLAELGYTTTAIHPYLPTGWDRNIVYPRLGFATFLSQYDFSSPKYLRNYISDESAFDKIIKEFEDKEKDERKFIFEVTMQNHSGYSKEYPGFTEEVHLTDLSYSNTQTKAVEKYLTLIKKSDEAVGELIAYFEKVEEPTIIVIFGDHEPTDYITSVIARITGYDIEDSLEEQQKSYMVPYLVWNNFDMKMDQMELVSANYLGADLLRAAGIPTTLYQDFLLNMQEQIPAVAANAYVDRDGVYHSFDEEASEHRELLNTYNILTYNHLYDGDHRVEGLFTLPEDIAGQGEE